MQYSFDESADKGVKVFDLTGAGVENLKDVPLTKGKRLVRLEADCVESALSLLSRYPDALVELKLFLTQPLAASEHAALVSHANLVSLNAEVCTEETLSFESRKGLTDEQLFDAFHKATYGTEAKEELKELFLQTLAETREN